MALTYKKRDDLDKVLSEFASFPDDLLNPKDKDTADKKEDSKTDKKKEGEKTK
ncbi:SPJ_0845 family protein [Streptococcaceae bacterium ESL0687]|nr:SPJ_0845 family protein [Streptococcaceae bacterium ESL0687]